MTLIEGVGDGVPTGAPMGVTEPMPEEGWSADTQQMVDTEPEAARV
jgi:hypothetical protein